MMSTPKKPHKKPVKAAKKADHEVCITAKGFSPASISIKVGECVTFKNDDTVPHTVSFDPGDSYEIPAGESHDQEFTSAGSWSYHCNFHPHMQGAVVVK
jgi:plastocyanin